MKNFCVENTHFWIIFCFINNAFTLASANSSEGAVVLVNNTSQNTTTTFETTLMKKLYSIKNRTDSKAYDIYSLSTTDFPPIALTVSIKEPIESKSTGPLTAIESHPQNISVSSNSTQPSFVSPSVPFFTSSSWLISELITAMSWRKQLAPHHSHDADEYSVDGDGRLNRNSSPQPTAPIVNIIDAKNTTVVIPTLHLHVTVVEGNQNSIVSLNNAAANRAFDVDIAEEARDKQLRHFSSISSPSRGKFELAPFNSNGGSTNIDGQQNKIKIFEGSDAQDHGQNQIGDHSSDHVDETLKISSSEDRTKNRTNYQLFDFPELSRSLNLSLDPCDDFYSFVCDGFLKENQISQEKSSFNQFQRVAENIEQKVKEILDNRNSFASLPPYDEMMFNLYDACMDNVTRGIVGGKTLIDHLAILKRSYELKYITDWLIRVHPITLFYDVAVVPDIENTTSNTILVTHNGLYLGNEKYYLGANAQFAPQLSALRRFLRRILELLSTDDKNRTLFHQDAKSNSADLDRRVESFVAVEMEMAKIFNETGKHYDNVYEDDIRITTKELRDNIASTINWARYIETIVPNEVIQLKFPNGIPLAQVRVNGVAKIRRLETMARQLPNQTLADYMDFRVILNEVHNLDDRYHEALFELSRSLEGTPKRAPKWKRCQSSVINVFGPLIERVYIRRHFQTENVRPQMYQMFGSVRASFKTMLEANDWMDSLTRDEALKKLASLNLHVGYMDHIYNESRLRQVYKEFNIPAGQPFPMMARNIFRWSTRQNYRQLLEPSTIDFNSLDINGFYYPTENAIVLTAGLLDNPFFNPQRPIALNYGSVGVVLAHEMTHGYDNSGRLHDERGNIRDWWNNVTAVNFRHKKRCFIHQYDRIQVTKQPALRINGEMTQGENIADNGGLRSAFLAFQQSSKTVHSRSGTSTSLSSASWKSVEDIDVAENDKETTLTESDNNIADHLENEDDIRIRGLEHFDTAQQFFLSYAFSWCTKLRPEAVIKSLMNDDHSPPEARVNVVLGNLREFAQHFSCPTGSRMNPGHKCAVW